MKMSATFLFVFFAVMLISCNSAENRWENSIRLSSKQAELAAERDSIVILTGGTWWWINDVKANGNYIYSNPEDIEKDYARLKGDWFSVEKQGKQKLVVKVDENISERSRKIVITVESGNYFEYIDVLQKGRK